MKWLFSLFLVAHGWAHIWYVVLSQRLIEYKAEYGWTGESWILSGLMGESASLVSTLGYSVSLLGFIAAGVGMYLGREWWVTLAYASAIISTVTIVLFWDGKLSMIINKGLIGLAINIAILILLRWVI